jgi:hypothetical protein
MEFAPGLSASATPASEAKNKAAILCIRSSSSLKAVAAASVGGHSHSY